MHCITTFCHDFIYNTTFGYKRLNILWSNTQWSFEPWPSNAAKQSFHKTLWLMTIYHQNKSGHKRIRSSKDKNSHSWLIHRLFSEYVYLVFLLVFHQFQYTRLVTITELVNYFMFYLVSSIYFVYLILSQFQNEHDSIVSFLPSWFSEHLFPSP